MNTIIDSHAHLKLEEKALKHLLSTMDKSGIAKTIVVGGGVVSPQQLSENIITGSHQKTGFDNRALLKLVANERHRIYPFYFSNPWDGPDEYAEIGQHFYGLKLAPIVHGVPFCDPKNLAILKHAPRFGHSVYLHCLDRDGLRIIDLVEVARLQPETVFIMGHGGMSMMDFHGIDVIRDQKNIYFETSGAFSAAIKYAAETLGKDRVLFGSEHPLQASQAEVVKAGCLGFDEETYYAYTHGNIARIAAGVET